MTHNKQDTNTAYRLNKRHLLYHFISMSAASRFVCFNEPKTGSAFSAAARLALEVSLSSRSAKVWRLLGASNLKARLKALQASRKLYFFCTYAVLREWLLEKSVRLALDTKSCVFGLNKLSVWKSKKSRRWSDSSCLREASYRDAHSASHTLEQAATLQAWCTIR